MDEERSDPVVLLVDDDEMERFLHRQVLEPAGFEIVETEDGATALEAFAITMPDIVVLDVTMPGMDGFAVCEAIRATPAGCNTPILMATGLDDVESIEKAYRVGATDFIAKPINRPVLPHRLRYMLRVYRLAEAQRIADVGNFRWMPKNSRIECSPEVSRMFGFGGNTGTQSARCLLRRVPSADRALLIGAARKALRGAKIELDHRILTPEGEVRTLAVRGEATTVEGAPKYLQGSYQDITERKRIETKLEAARDEAQTASAAKTAFLAGMSHELHTPLNAIIGFSELIAQEAFGPIAERKYIEFADAIRNAGQRALTVFQDVQTMAELEAERFQLSLETIDLCEVTTAMVVEFRQTEWAAGRELVLHANGSSLVIQADRRAVKQMILKLLSNAAKFSPAGTVICITLARAGDGSPRVSIADTGIGMTAEEAGLAVRPFGQVDRGLARRYDGLGLGLSIVSKLIECHGGRLRIASAPQKGTQVSLDFPAPRPRSQKSLSLRRVADVADKHQPGPSGIERSLH
jgi:signal transduction histidine kinase